LIEARKILVRAPTATDEVAAFLQSITEPPAREFTPSFYLALRSAYWRLQTALDAEGVNSVVDQLWDIAVAIEDGAVGDSETKLRQAREALNEALANNADSAELARRIEAMKQALAQFLSELARKQAAAPQTGTIDPSVQSITPDELMAQLDRLDQLAQTG